jgi:energy-coupling factor transporter transmembrane protein EcfT
MQTDLKNYIKSIEEKLAQGDGDWQKLLAEHRVQIGFFQHERLIHLLVTLFFGLIFFLAVIAGIFFAQLCWGILGAILLILLISYIGYYFYLENGVQKLYKLDAEIAKKLEK